MATEDSPEPTEPEGGAGRTDDAVAERLEHQADELNKEAEALAERAAEDERIAAEHEAEAAELRRRDLEHVIVTYNGPDKKIPARPAEEIRVLTDKAMNAFGIQENRHVLALWTEQGVELELDKTVADYGLHDCQLLVLRPSAVRGGLS